MQLKSDVPACPSFTEAEHPSTLAWQVLCDQSLRSRPQFTAATWVRLLNPPTAFSFDQAWLLCPCDNQQWLAWVPDYGELLLSTDEFCNL